MRCSNCPKPAQSYALVVWNDPQGEGTDYYDGYVCADHEATLPVIGDVVGDREVIEVDVIDLPTAD
jgi:hypothetical protein